MFRLSSRPVVKHAVLCVALPLVASSASAAGPDDVRREFEAICRTMESGSNLYYGRGTLADLHRKLERIEDPMEAAATRGMVGKTLMQLGEIDEAIAELEAVLALTASGLDKRLYEQTLWYLALAYLQKGEDQNCVDNHSSASCIVPILPEGVHQRPEPSRRAAEFFLQYLEESPNDVQAAWLLNLARRVSGDFPGGVPRRLQLPDDAFRSSASMRRWRDVAPQLGVATVDLAGGAVIDDFDGDGLLDLVSSTWDPCDGLKAFRNDGTGGFEDVSEAWGLSRQLGGLNLLQVDYDGDGRLDLFVLRGAWMVEYGTVRNSLLRNVARGEGVAFVDMTRVAGLAEPGYPTQAAAWADYDLDGDLDLYIGNEKSRLYDPGQLFRNDGPDANGTVTFTDVARASGVLNDRYCKAVAWGDYDNDGDPDLYVSNYGPNRLYRNDGLVDGSTVFHDVAVELGVDRPERESFTTWFFDYDNDGDLDLFVADYRQKAVAVSASYFGMPVDTGQPLLYRNDDGRFEEVSRQVGLTRPLMPMGANYGDLDNDGWLDIYIGTGEPDLSSLMPNVMYRNVGGRFEDVTFVGGFGHLQKGHGVAFGDLDNDGDQDLFHQLGGFYPSDAYANALFENPGASGNWIAVDLEGKRANRFGVGARVEAKIIDAGTSRSVHAVVGTGGSFGSSTLRLELGLAQAEKIEELIIWWPGSGTTDRHHQLDVNRFYRIVEGAPDVYRVDRRAFRLGADG